MIGGEVGPDSASGPTSFDSSTAASRGLTLFRQHDWSNDLRRRANGHGNCEGEQCSRDDSLEPFPGHLISPFWMVLESEDVGPPGIALMASGFEDVRL